MGSEVDAAKAIELFNGYVWQTRSLEVKPETLPPEYDLPGPQSQLHNQHFLRNHQHHYYNQNIFPWNSHHQFVTSPILNHPYHHNIYQHSGTPTRVYTESVLPAFENNYNQQYNDTPTLLNKGIVRPSANAMQQLGIKSPHTFDLMPSPNLSLTNKTLFIGNLPLNLHWKSLKQLFVRAGNVTRAEIAMKEDGTSKGYGIIVYSTEIEANNAVHLFDGYEINGHFIKVYLDNSTNNNTNSNILSPASSTTTIPSSTNQSNQTLNTNNINTAFKLASEQKALPFSNQTLITSSQSTPNSGLGIITTSSNLSASGSTSDVGKSSPFTSSSSPPPNLSSPSYPLPRMPNNNNNDINEEKEIIKNVEKLKINDNDISNNEKTIEQTTKNENTNNKESSNNNNNNNKAVKKVFNHAGPHPGKISLPPATISNQTFQQHQQNMNIRGVPMTPSMPGFYFGSYAVPPTPKYVPELLSPGVGLYSPGVITSPPLSQYNPFLNPAPGAPIHYAPSTPSTPGFNPMFPPIYQMQPYHPQQPNIIQQNIHHQQNYLQPQAPSLQSDNNDVNYHKETDGYPFPIITDLGDTQPGSQSNSSGLTTSQNQSAISSSSDKTVDVNIRKNVNRTQSTPNQNGSSNDIKRPELGKHSKT